MMNEKYLRVLEFPKIRERMAALATTELGRERARALQPSSDAALVRRRVFGANHKHAVELLG